MLPYFVFDHFNIGPLRFYTWGLFVGLAFSAGYLFVLYRARAKNIEISKIIGLTLAIFFGVAIGSRLLFLLQEPQKFLADVSSLWRIEQGGLMLWGGLLGGILGAWIYIRLYFSKLPPLLNKERVGVRYSFWTFADLLTPAVALGIGIGRIGCFLINDHLGVSTNLPWGILWPDGISRHPVALYESLAGFGLFFIFWFLQKKLNQRAPQLRGALDTNSVIPAAEPGSRILDSRFRGNDNAGVLFLLFLVAYAIFRFLLDFLRVSQGILADPRWWSLTSSQWISILILSVAILFIFVRRDPETSLP